MKKHVPVSDLRDLVPSANLFADLKSTFQQIYDEIDELLSRNDKRVRDGTFAQLLNDGDVLLAFFEDVWRSKQPSIDTARVEAWDDLQWGNAETPVRVVSSGLLSVRFIRLNHQWVYASTVISR